MKPQQIISLLLVVGAFSLEALAQNAVQWKNYVDSANDIWFQASASILIDRDGDAKAITLHTFFDGVKVSVRKQELDKDPMKYVKGLDLPFGEKGSKVQDFKSSAFYVRQENEPLGDDLSVTLYAGSKKSYFVINIIGSKDNIGIKRFLGTIRFGGSRLYTDSTIQEMTVNNEPVIFDQLPSSPETGSALMKKRIGPEPVGKFGDVRARLPLDLDKLSGDVIVLRKPRPSYTDDARMRNIQGTILANVQFLASGDIGTITVDNRADRGLAQNVILAVRKIKFIPAKANGISVDVTRTILYKFSIY